MDLETILGRVWLHLNELSINPNTILYFYCALELRFFIEALFFELLVHFKNGGLKRRDLKIYKPKEFAALLEQLEPDYLAKASTALGIAITPEDLTRIMELYGRLGACLHLPKEPFFSSDQEEWKNDLEVLVIGAFNYFNTLTGNKWPT